MAKPKRVTFISTRLEDTPGALLKILQDLKAKNIGLVGLWGTGAVDGKAKLIAVPKDANKLRTIWQGTGTIVEEGTAFLLSGADKTGALVKNLETLATSGINIKMIAAVAGGEKFASLLWVAPEQLEDAAKALGAK